MLADGGTEMDRRTFTIGGASIAALVGCSPKAGLLAPPPPPEGNVDLVNHLFAIIPARADVRNPDCPGVPQYGYKDRFYRNPEIVAHKVEFGDTIIVEGPRFETPYEQPNCTSTSKEWTDTFELKDLPKEVTEVKLDRRLISSPPLMVHLPRPTSNYGQGISLNLSDAVVMKRERIVSADNARIGQSVVPPGKLGIVVARRDIQRAVTPFKITLTVDGMVIMAWGDLRDCRGRMSVLLSRVLNDDQRSFVVTGTITDDRVKTLSLVSKERDITPRDC